MTAPAEQAFGFHTPVDVAQIRRDVSPSIEQGKVAFVHIAGASASGKSTVAQHIATELPRTSVLAIDDYLAAGLSDGTRTFNHDAPDPAKPYIGGISPEIWDLPLLQRHLSRLVSLQTIWMPRFDETLKDRAGYEPFTPKDCIVLEGGHAFIDPFVEYANHKVYVRAPLHDRLTRKMVRTHLQHGRNDVDEVLGRYLTRDEYACCAYDAEFSEMADQVVENHADPRSDYAGMQTKAASEAAIDASISPRAGTGILRPGEEFTITQSGSDYGVRYSVDGRVLVDLPISAETRELLLQQYERI